jgi:small-conductance mechanosensitive channel
MTILLFVFEQPATGLLTVSSVVIAAIGFALRNVISDVFAGIAPGIDHPYRIVDWIATAQGSAGKLAEITWRTTRPIDRNGSFIILPNGLLPLGIIADRVRVQIPVSAPSGRRH